MGTGGEGGAGLRAQGSAAFCSRRRRPRAVAGQSAARGAQVSAAAAEQRRVPPWSRVPGLSLTPTPPAPGSRCRCPPGGAPLAPSALARGARLCPALAAGL